MPLTITNETANQNASVAATLTLTLVTADVGDMLVLVIVADNSGTNGASSISTPTDDGGNTYVERVLTLNDPGAADAGTTLAIYTALITTALNNDSVVCNFSPNTGPRCAQLYRVQPGGGEIPTFRAAGAGSTGNGTSPSITATGVRVGDTIFGALAAETGNGITQDSDTTNGSWSTQRQATVGGGGAASQRISSQWKTVDATGDQTYGPTINTGAADYAINWITIYPVATVGAWHQPMSIPRRHRLVTPEGLATSAIDATSFAPPETILTDKWYGHWREPVRRITRRLGVIVDRIDISHPDVSGWTQPIATPTRRITRRYGAELVAFDPSSFGAFGWPQPLSPPTLRKVSANRRGSIIDAINTDSPDVSGWTQPIATPTRRIWTANGRGPFTIDRIDISHPNLDTHLQPLAIPTRRKTSPNNRGAFTVDRIDISHPDISGWGQPLSLPVRRVTRRYGEEIEAFDASSMAVYGWPQPLSLPVRRRWSPNGRTEFRDFINRSSPSVSAWTAPLSEPVRRKWGVNVRGHFAIIGFDPATFQIEPVPEESWFHPLSIPVRAITRRYGIMVDRINPVGTPPPTFSWFHPFSHQVPLPHVPRRGRFPAHLRLGLLRDIDPTPPIFASHWHRQWSEPKRFLRDPKANVVLMATAGGIWVTTGAYEPGPDEIMLSDQFSPFVYTAELNPWATGRA